MRTRLLVLLASAAACVGTAFVAAAPAAQAKPAPNVDWSLCTSATDTYCIESATADGVPTTPEVTGTPRDYPWVQFVGDNLIDFGVWRETDDTGVHLANDVDPDVTYRLVVRTGSFIPREMHAIARNGSYAIGRSATTGWRFVVQFQPTWVHHSAPGSCSVDGGCVPDTTKATWDVPGYATGGIETLVGSGLSDREIAQRTGMATFTNAQDSYIFYNIDLGVLEVRLANPHLTAAGTPVTDGSYDAFIPNAYLTGTVGVPDPTVLPGFTVTKTVGSTTLPASATMTHLPNGIKIHIGGISFSRPTYRLKPRPTPPGRPRAVVARKISAHSARVRFVRPVANGGRRIDLYQARCHRAGKAWHYARRTVSPITVKNLPRGRVLCQVRAHNVKGYGRWSALDRT